MNLLENLMKALGSPPRKKKKKKYVHVELQYNLKGFMYPWFHID